MKVNTWTLYVRGEKVSSYAKSGGCENSSRGSGMGGMGVRGNGVSYLKWCGLSNSTPEVALD